MAKSGKRMKAIREKYEKGRLYPVGDAFTLAKELATAKFKESLDVSVNLGVDPKKSDQVVRRSTVLPHGTGKTIRVAVFAQGDNAEAAKQFMHNLRQEGIDPTLDVTSQIITARLTLQKDNHQYYPPSQDPEPRQPIKQPETGQ